MWGFPHSGLTPLWSSYTAPVGVPGNGYLFGAVAICAASIFHEGVEK